MAYNHNFLGVLDSLSAVQQQEELAREAARRISEHEATIEGIVQDLKRSIEEQARAGREHAEKLVKQEEEARQIIVDAQNDLLAGIKDVTEALQRTQEGVLEQLQRLNETMFGGLDLAGWSAGGPLGEMAEGEVPATLPCTGDVKLTHQKVAPPGWIVCDGSEREVLLYPGLYQVIGTAYGLPSGPGYFRLPGPEDLTGDGTLLARIAVGTLRFVMRL